MSMTTQQKAVLIKAASMIEVGDLSNYFEVRRLFPLVRSGQANETEQGRFEKAFSKFYAMDGRVWPPAERRFFYDLLYGLHITPASQPYRRLLNTLAERRNGNLEFSFVSKLVATHDEKRPIWDVHVRAFFGLKPPKRGSPRQRITEFLRQLKFIRRQYQSWHPDFGDVAHEMQDRIQPLRNCHENRICDLLVWTAGKRGLIG
jgi:hypothetical protein